MTVQIIDEIDKRIADVIAAPELSFVELMVVAGLDPGSALRHANLAHVDFSNCDLTGFDLMQSCISGANFTNAIIAGARFDANQLRMDELKLAADYEDLIALLSPSEWSVREQARRLDGVLKSAERSVQYDYAKLLKGDYAEFTRERIKSGAYSLTINFEQFEQLLSGRLNYDTLVEQLVSEGFESRRIAVLQAITLGCANTSGKEMGEEFFERAKIAQSVEYLMLVYGLYSIGLVDSIPLYDKNIMRAQAENTILESVGKSILMEFVQSLSLKSEAGDFAFNGISIEKHFRTAQHQKISEMVSESVYTACLHKEDEVVGALCSMESIGISARCFQLGALLGCQSMYLSSGDAGLRHLNERDNGGRTPLWLAIYAGQTQVAETLLRRSSVDSDQPDDCGITPLELACAKGRADICEAILRIRNAGVGVSNNKLGSSPMSFAIMEGHLDVVRTLVEVGNANVNLRDLKGIPPVEFAYGLAMNDIGEYLESKGAVRLGRRAM